MKLNVQDTSQKKSKLKSELDQATVASMLTHTLNADVSAGQNSNLTTTPLLQKAEKMKKYFKAA